MGDNESSQKYVVGLTFNLKRDNGNLDAEEEAEYDSIETVNAIKETIEKLSCKVALLEADKNIFTALQDIRPDIVFNIAEGTNGRGREAQIPALLSFLGTPYTGSDETTLCIALDKALCKKILKTFNINSPKYQLINSPKYKLNNSLKFPLIAKPNFEGSSKGISENAIIYNQEDLKNIVDVYIKKYRQPLLLEEFINGREFTVGVIGNGKEAKAYEPMEIIYKNEGDNIYSFKIKQNCYEYVDYVCPAKLDDTINKKMKNLAVRIHNSLQCKDFSRVDFRLSEEGKIFFIEINPLPGLTPNYSDYPMLAGYCGISFDKLIKNILNNALARYDMSQL
jgi:D-alanine-D-alanine ligase